MLRRTLSLGLASLLILNLPLASRASGRAQQNDSQQQRLKEKAFAITPGTMVEVRLLNKEKVRGRIGDLSDAGFSLQTAKDGTIQKRTVSFDELKSIKAVEGKGPKIGRGVAYALAGVGGFVLIAIIVCSTSGCGG